MERKTSRRKIFLSAHADNVLLARTSPRVQRTVLTNSILIRYQSIMAELENVITKKFNPEEQQALINVYSDYCGKSEKQLWFFENSTHIQAFCKVYRDALTVGHVGELTASQSDKLLEILERHLSTSEFIALCDWISIQSLNRTVLNDV